VPVISLGFMSVGLCDLAERTDSSHFQHDMCDEVVRVTSLESMRVALVARRVEGFVPLLSVQIRTHF